MKTGGKLTVFYGCMFAGKTTALINHLSDLSLKSNELVVLKPSIDTRAGKNVIKTHDGRVHDCVLYERDSNINEFITPYTRLIALDETQFFDKVFLSEIKRLLAKGIHIVAAGLDKDYLNRPFGLMSVLIEMADEKNHLMAKCENCGNDAEFSFRKVKNNVLILIGSSDHYEARCKDCLNL